MNTMSLKARIGGLIVGWIFTMVVALVTRIVKRALAKQQQQAQMRTQTSPRPSPAKPDPVIKDAPYKSWAVTDTIFQGMSKTELIAAYGEPATRMKASDVSEIWTYGSSNSANDNGMTVTIESGFVTDWTEAASTTL
jgi:hypothetical protein